MKDVDQISYDEPTSELMVLVEQSFYETCVRLGLYVKGSCRNYNVGDSDYSKHFIQPWSIWMDYNLNPWDADIIKRVLRTKSTDSREMDYRKIIHDCEERLRQLNY